jgi:hypothetical protein
MEESGIAESEPTKKPFAFHHDFKEAVYFAGIFTFIVYMVVFAPQHFIAYEITSNPTKVVQGCFIEGRDIEENGRENNDYIVTTNCGVFEAQSFEHMDSLIPWDKYTLEVSTGYHKYIIAAVNEKTLVNK